MKSDGTATVTKGQLIATGITLLVSFILLVSSIVIVLKN